MAVTGDRDRWTAFRTPLGWMVILGHGMVLKQVTFGHPSRQAAIEAMDPELARRACHADWNPGLVGRLQAYASGRRDDFLDIEVDPGRSTDFQRCVLDCCRRIPFGTTITYSELAARAGRQGAARAVGNCMAGNRIPLVIPCHRIVAANGKLGGYSAPGGIDLKLRLLEMEALASSSGRRPDRFSR